MIVPDKLNRWQIFKDELPHMREPYSRRNWGNELHSLCSYQGKMKPALAHHLVEVFTDRGEAVLDPFSGSGTIPFEASLLGRRPLALDISLMASAITTAKIGIHHSQKCWSIVSNLEDYMKHSDVSQKTAKDMRDVRFNKTIPEYFHEKTLGEIARARDYFLAKLDHTSPDWALVFSCMLHILHGNRPYALSRRSHPITPYAPTGEFEEKSVIEKLSQKLSKSLDVERGPGFVVGQCLKADILGDWSEAFAGQLDAIITSPPFASSTRFYMTNWMRFWFSGWGIDEFNLDSKKFVEDIQKRNMLVYDPILSKCHNVLKDNGLAIFHLGTGTKSNMGRDLLPIAKKYFEIVDLFEETVEHCEKHGIRDKGSVTGHQYLVLRKL